jgi:transcriptional regulator with XRE-family HTH domain
MINGALIRAARSLIGWSGKTLAERAHIGTATLQRIEQAQHTDCGQFRTIQRIEDTLTDAGIRFLEEPAGGIGVALSREKVQEILCRHMAKDAR